MAAPAGSRIARRLSLALAAGLLLWGVPQTAASLLRVYADAWAAPASFETTEARASALWRVRMLKTASWFGDPKALVDAGVLELRLALAPKEGSPPDDGELGRAASDLAAGLARRPADAMGWAALAHARLALAEGKKAAAAFKTAVLLDPYGRALVPWRSELGLRLWWMLDGDGRRLLYEQLAALWDQEPKTLLALARRREYATVITIALAQDPRKLIAFEKAQARR